MITIFMVIQCFRADLSRQWAILYPDSYTESYTSQNFLNKLLSSSSDLPGLARALHSNGLYSFSRT